MGTDTGGSAEVVAAHKAKGGLPLITFFPSNLQNTQAQELVKNYSKCYEYNKYPNILMDHLRNERVIDPINYPPNS